LIGGDVKLEVRGLNARRQQRSHGFPFSARSAGERRMKKLLTTPKWRKVVSKM
jgi:hypothetical protein